MLLRHEVLGKGEGMGIGEREMGKMKWLNIKNSGKSQ